MATTTANDILSATQNYGKAETAFSIAVKQAANQREQAMIGLGADFTTQTGSVLSPGQVADAYGSEGDRSGLTMRTGFGEGALPTIAKTQAGAVYQQEQALLEKGVGGGSGVTGQAKLITQDQGAVETQSAVQDFQGKVAEAAVAEGAAKLDERNAAADLATAEQRVLPIGKPKAAGLLPLRANSRGGIVKASSRGTYTSKVTPKGASVPKDPKAGQSFKGAGGVVSVYRPEGPKGAGWYKKGKK